LIVAFLVAAALLAIFHLVHHASRA
jgi:hypothetical protein